MKKRKKEPVPPRAVEVAAVNLADGIFVLILQRPSSRCVVLSVDEAMAVRGTIGSAINRAVELQRKGVAP